MAKLSQNTASNIPLMVKRSVAGYLLRLGRRVYSPPLQGPSTDNEPLQQNFYVCYRDSIRESTTGTKVFVDGQPCGSQISYAHDAAESHHSDRPSTLILKGAMTSGDIRRPFLFSDCQLVGKLYALFSSVV